MSHTLQWNANHFDRAARSTMWTVTAYGAHDRRVYATHPLEYADKAREQHDYWSARPFVQRVDLAELTTDITERFINLDDLPAPGRPAALPDLPDGAHHVGRHYHFTWGVKVLRTPDDVRRYYKWLADAQVDPLPTSPRIDLDSLRLLEVTLIRRVRPVERNELPA